MPALTDPQLHFLTLGKTINNIQPPQSYIRNLLFPSGNTHFTESVEVGFYDDIREVAAFVPRGAKAVQVRGDKETRRTITPPNIRLVRTLDPMEVFAHRRVGYPGHVTSEGTVRASGNEYVARQLLRMRTMIANAEELLAAKVVQGPFTYALGDRTTWAPGTPLRTNFAHFTLDYGIVPITKATAADAWDGGASGAPGATAHVLRDIRIIQRLASDTNGLPINLAICGRNIAKPFYDMPDVQKYLDNFRMQIGQLAPGLYDAMSGSIYLGRYGGVDFVEYNRALTLYSSNIGDQLLNPNTNSIVENLIDDNSIIFVSMSNMSDFGWDYGAHFEAETLKGRSLRAKVYTDMWTDRDPGQVTHLAACRPVPSVPKVGSVFVLKPLVASVP